MYKKLKTQNSLNSNGSKYDNYAANDDRSCSRNNNIIGGIENWDEYGIVQEMISEVKTTHDFRHIQKLTFKARENISEDPVLYKELFSPKGDVQNSSVEVQRTFIKFQTSFIEKWRKIGGLPLPLIKKIQFKTLVLDNYQINNKISKALGRSLHFLGNNLKGIKLINNNMNDDSISYILNGMIFNPIGKCT